MPTLSRAAGALLALLPGAGLLCRDARGGRMVCGGIRFGYRGADRRTRWIPAGSCYARARALADSVRKAQS